MAITGEQQKPPWDWGAPGPCSFVSPGLDALGRACAGISDSCSSTAPAQVCWFRNNQLQQGLFNVKKQKKQEKKKKTINDQKKTHPNTHPPLRKWMDAHSLPAAGVRDKPVRNHKEWGKQNTQHCTAIPPPLSCLGVHGAGGCGPPL